MPILENFKLKAKRLRFPGKALLTQNVFQKSEDIVMFLCIMHVRDIVLYLIKIVFYFGHPCGLCVEIRSRTLLKNYLLMALIAF